MNDLQAVVNKFLDNMDLLENDVLEAIAHLIEVELQERDFVSNPQNFKAEDDDVN